MRGALLLGAGLLGCSTLRSLLHPAPPPLTTHTLSKQSIADYNAVTGLRLMVQTGHRPAPIQVAASADGTLAATGGADGLVLLWDTRNERQILMMSTSSEPIRELIWSTDPADGEDELIVLDGQGRVTVWQPGARDVQEFRHSSEGASTAIALDQGSSRSWFRTDPGTLYSRDDTISLAIHPKATLLALGSSAGLVRQFTREGAPRGPALLGHQGAVQVAYTEDGRLLTAGEEGTVRLWPTHPKEDGEPERRWSLEGAARALVSTGALAITADESGAVCAWRLADGREAWCLRKPPERPVGLAVIDDERLVVRYTNGQARELWLKTGRPTSSTRDWSKVTDVAATHSGLILGMQDGRAVLSLDEQPLRRLSQLVSVGQRVSLSGRWLLLGGAGDTQSLWFLSDAQRLHSLATPGALDAALAASAPVLAVLRPDGQLVLHDISAYAITERAQVSSGLTIKKEETAGVVLDGDGRTALVASAAGQVNLIDLHTDPGKILWDDTFPTEEPVHMALSDSGRSVAIVSESGNIVVGDVSTAPFKARIIGDVRITDVAIDEKGEEILITGSRWSSSAWRGSAWRYRTDGTLLQSWILDGSSDQAALAAHLSRDGEATISTDRAQVCTLPQKTAIQDCGPSGGMPLLSLTGSQQEPWLVGSRNDGGAQLWRRSETADNHLRLVALPAAHAGDRGSLAPTPTRTDWIAIHPRSRRYDAAFAGDLPGLYWTLDVHDPDAVISISLAQLKERYFYPGLLADFLSGASPSQEETALPEPPAVWLRAVPDVTQDPRLTLAVGVTPRAGGIGRAFIKLNGKEVSGTITDSAAGEGAPPAERTLTLALAGEPALQVGPNQIEVQVFDAADEISAAPLQVRFDVPQPARSVADVQRAAIASGGRRAPIREAPDTDPRVGLYVLVVGIADYDDPLLQLQYPAQDAREVYTLLQSGAQGPEGSALFDPVEVRLLLDEVSGQSVSADDIREAAAELVAMQSPEDIFGIYLAGHGVVAEDGTWHFLTSHASARAATSAGTSFSTEDLATLLKSAPAQKQAVVLDTCAAGVVADTIASERAGRIALEQLKDRTGLLILAAASGAEAAYESDRLGHGLLTAALLLGLRNEALADLYNDYWFVGPLFDFTAEQVQVLAADHDILQRQRPVVARPTTSSFFIGRWSESIGNERGLPVLGETTMINRDHLGDPLHLGASIDARLSAQAQALHTAQGEPLFIKRDRAESAIRLWGIYEQRDGEIVVQVGLLRGNEVLSHLEETIPTEAATERLTAWVLDALGVSGVQ